MRASGSGTSGTSSEAEGGARATWQWTHSTGSFASKGSLPVSIWKKVTPSE